MIHGRGWPGERLARGEAGPGRGWPGERLARGEAGPASRSNNPRVDPQDQGFNRGNGMEVIGDDLVTWYHDIEFSFDREHQIDHIRRSQSDLCKLIIN
jgi:hypothetical protein